ncbi:hypothetical protein N7489_005666 [Penicillium chrysogenum]|uniref:Uncharacterized protein n=1 Tax=Penicillium chrysogenum TaxID=5076 RepID=A0ABQ8WNL8_PENCH|nr:uncharacterized protein N7489_005666 [Penicillium chrysogenum]KAJ5245570.1 hypothetical protein N7489_005666 [Penicillium chrysogenum]KAJ5274334.1 hypothetical protein N7505_002879 [Penicillium chrysogenum]KAJ6156049.1 hypothetical protein N7497_004934 [Penicillium chrysogenum]
MFRSAFRPFSSLRCARSALTARYFHHVTTDFTTHDARGNLVTRKVPIVIGNPGETYVLIEQEVGSALRAASPFISTSVASAEDRCKLTFFHDSQHFGFGLSTYPRLYIPSQIPRQTESNTSPATLFLDGKTHEIVLDGTPDATFAEHASATGRNLATVLDQLKDM